MKKELSISPSTLLNFHPRVGFAQIIDDKFVNLCFNNGKYSLLNYDVTGNETGELANHNVTVTRLPIANDFTKQGEALTSERGITVEYDNFIFGCETNLQKFNDSPLLFLFELKTQQNRNASFSVFEFSYKVNAT